MSSCSVWLAQEARHSIPPLVSSPTHTMARSSILSLLIGATQIQNKTPRKPLRLQSLADTKFYEASPNGGVLEMLPRTCSHTQDRQSWPNPPFFRIPGEAQSSSLKIRPHHPDGKQDGAAYDGTSSRLLHGRQDQNHQGHVADEKQHRAGCGILRDQQHLTIAERNASKAPLEIPAPFTPMQNRETYFLLTHTSNHWTRKGQGTKYRAVESGKADPAG